MSGIRTSGTSSGRASPKRSRARHHEAQAGAFRGRDVEQARVLELLEASDAADALRQFITADSAEQLLIKPELRVQADVVVKVVYPTATFSRLELDKVLRIQPRGVHVEVQHCQALHERPVERPPEVVATLDPYRVAWQAKSLAPDLTDDDGKRLVEGDVEEPNVECRDEILDGRLVETPGSETWHRIQIHHPWPYACEPPQVERVDLGVLDEAVIQSPLERLVTGGARVDTADGEPPNRRTLRRSSIASVSRVRRLLGRGSAIVVLSSISSMLR